METRDPVALSSALDSVTTRITTAKVSSDRAEEKLQREGFQKWCELRSRIGPRYEDCRLDNFKLSDDPKISKRQKSVIESLRKYGESMDDNIKDGRGIVLFGPAGTGKDHLLSVMMRNACWHNFSVEWRNGMDLYADRRDAITKDYPERQLIDELTKPDVLAISDPVPPWGNLTEGQAEFLFRVVDARYRRRKAVWVTANFAAGDEAENRIGNQVVDRLRDGALAIRCDWPSFRKRSDVS